MSWHVGTETLERYSRGAVGDTTVFSVEQHLLGCERCRDALAPSVDAAQLERIWAGVAVTVHAPDPRRHLGERVLIALGLPEHRARLLARTPSLQPSWILAVAASLLFATLAARSIGGDLPFLLAAPLVPVLGVAVAYSRSFDDPSEMLSATPTGGFRLMLIRATAVIAVSVLICGLATLALPRAGWSVAWLLPSLALTVGTLVLSTASTTGMVAGLVTAGWIGGVFVTGRLTSEPLAAFDGSAQLVWAGLLVLAVVVMLARRDAFEMGAPR